MAMNISCKFEKASYNIFFVRAVTVKSLYTLRRRRRRNEVKSIVSTGCYPVDTTMAIMQTYDSKPLTIPEKSLRSLSDVQYTTKILTPHLEF